MKWRAFASDFDGTIATDGAVMDVVTEALKRVQKEGIKLLLVTGRELKDFDPIQSILNIFDCIVAENGAVLYFPERKKKEVLAERPAPELVDALMAYGVPVSIGEVIVGTTELHQSSVLSAVKESAADVQLIFNKGSLMILPSGVNKAAGLKEALDRFEIRLSETIGIGDAENDSGFLQECGLSVAVANAVPALKKKVSYVTSSIAGIGVVEFIDLLLKPRLSGIDRFI